MGKIHFNGAPPSKIRFNSNMVPRMYLGTDLIWDAATGFEGPKIDQSHALANRTTMKRLTLGQLEGMTADANYIVANNAFASKIAGTVSFLKEVLPATSPTSLRISALIKIDKTAGRYSRVAFAFSSNPGTLAADIYVGHTAGTGIVVNSHGGGISLSQTVISEAALVDGAWYRMSAIWETMLDQNTGTTNASRNRVYGSAEPVDPVNNPAAPWYVTNWTSKTAMTNVPLSITARTNSALGTIRDFRYVDSLFGINDDDAPIQYNAKMGDGSNGSDLMWLWSKAKAAPLRVIVTSGGSGLYGGADWATGTGRTGQPYDKWRQTWRDLANLGYTVLHTNALHEGWGADDHLTKQLEALNLLKTYFGMDIRVYYLGYSMGGLSAWRAILGRAGFPAIRAAYLVAGAIGLDRYYDIGAYAQIKTRWPNRALLDEPMNFSGAELIARGTRVRLVTSTGDTNMPKVDNHDVMKAKYAGSSLFSELVHTGINHFDPAYWDVSDMVAFFEGQDTGDFLFTDSFNRASFGGLPEGWSIFGGGFSIVSNQAAGTGASYNLARTTAAVPSNNGYSEVVVSTYSTSSLGVMIRVPGDVVTGYLWRYNGTDCQLFAATGGSFTAVGTPYAVALTAPFTLRISAVGTTISGYVNGVLRSQHIEGALSTGAYGGLRVEGTATRIDDFKLGVL